MGSRKRNLIIAVGLGLLAIALYVLTILNVLGRAL